MQDGAYSKVSYGASTELLVKDAVAGGGYVRVSYLQFNLTGIARITSASLQLHGSEQAGAVEPLIGVGIYPVSNSNWAQSSLTDANAPTIGATLLASANITGTTLALYKFNLTTYLQQQQALGNKVVSIAIKGTAFTKGMVGFNSTRAGSNAPQLVLGTSKPTPTPTPAPTPKATSIQPAVALQPDSAATTTATVPLGGDLNMQNDRIQDHPFVDMVKVTRGFFNLAGRIEVFDRPALGIGKGRGGYAG